MPTGSYNVSRLLEELGLKNVLEMPVRPEIQPVIQLDSMAGQVPAHVGSVALIGGQTGAQAGELSIMDLNVLDPGGGILMFVNRRTLNTFYEIRLSTVPTAFATVGPTRLTNLNFTNGPPTPSFADVGSTLEAATGITFQFGDSGFGWSGYAPLYVPRGTHLKISTLGVTQELRIGLGWCGITATESE